MYGKYGKVGKRFYVCERHGFGSEYWFTAILNACIIKWVLPGPEHPDQKYLKNYMQSPFLDNVHWNKLKTIQNCCQNKK